MRRFFVLVLLVGLSAAAEAQTPQPYAGMQTREVKSLSPSQLDDLRQGRGMGLALPAELNGYPGPAHVLELADKLSLSAQQRERMQSLFSAMKAEAIPLGEALIAQETELDRQFASRTVTPVTLAAMTQTIGGTQGALRAAHLKYHLSTLETLTPEQLQQYAKLRGYGDNVQQHEHQRRH